MKTAVIFLGVMVAMASARNGVQVAENSGYNQNGGFQVDPGFGKPSFGQGQGSIDPGFGRPTYGNGNNGQIVDPGFYRPSVGQPNSGLPQPGFGPTFVNEQPQNNGGWPRKQYNNPALRGGK